MEHWSVTYWWSSMLIEKLIQEKRLFKSCSTLFSTSKHYLIITSAQTNSCYHCYEDTPVRELFPVKHHLCCLRLAIPAYEHCAAMFRHPASQTPCKFCLNPKNKLWFTPFGWYEHSKGSVHRFVFRQMRETLKKKKYISWVLTAQYIFFI